MRVSRLLVVIAVAALLLGSAAQSQAAVILSDNFDSYVDGGGGPDQAAFEANWPSINTVGAGILTQAQAVSTPNSVSIPSNGTVATRRSRASLSETGTVDPLNKIIWSFDYFDSVATAQPYRNYANLQDTTAPGSTNQLISMGLNNNQTNANSGGAFYMARILGYTVPTTADPDGGPAETVGGASAYFKLNDFGVGLRTTGWHNLKVEISTDDGASTDYHFFVDGVLAERVSNIGTALQIRSYDNMTIGSGVSSTTGAFFDNAFLEFAVIPEPASLTLFGMAGVGLLRRRRPH